MPPGLQRGHTHRNNTMYVNMNIMYESMWHTHTHTNTQSGPCVCVCVCRVDGFAEVLQRGRGMLFVQKETL